MQSVRPIGQAMKSFVAPPPSDHVSNPLIHSNDHLAFERGINAKRTPDRAGDEKLCSAPPSDHVSNPLIHSNDHLAFERGHEEKGRLDGAGAKKLCPTFINQQVPISSAYSDLNYFYTPKN